MASENPDTVPYVAPDDFGPSVEPFPDGDASTALAKEPEPEPVVLTAEERAEAVSAANALKVDGNNAYASEAYDEAIALYTQALERAPVDEAAVRAIYHCNRAAAYLAVMRWDDAVRDCDEAIKRDAMYVKAFLRRAKAREELDQLQGALDDYTKVAELAPDNDEARIKVRELPPRVAEQNEKLKNEMLGKLKDLGNTILGKFGMSLDNFQFTQDPKSGGYSVNMKQ